MTVDPDFIPNFTPKDIGKLADRPWLSYDEPQVILTQGMRGAGKGVVCDNMAIWLYKAGFNIWHLWGARSLENLYYIINKNCLEKYHNLKIIVDSFYEDNFLKLNQRCECKGLRKKDFDGYLDKTIQSGLVKHVDEKTYRLTDKGKDLHFGRLLHCNCHKAFPVTWMVPNYIQMDEESVERFNGVYWKDFEEYQHHLSEITTEEKKLLEEAKQKKPSYLRPKPLIIVRKITPPTSAQRSETFREEFIKIILEAREQHRIVVMNPAIFEGSLDKFECIAEIFKMMKHLMNNTEHFLPLTEEQVGKPRKYWSRKQMSWHKVAIIINELRSVSPSSQLSGEKEANRSKRAIFDFIPEARHYRVTLIGDYQRPDDVLPTIRHNPNITIVKNGSRNILGDDWKWLFDTAEKWQMSVTSKILRRDVKSMNYVRYMKEKSSKLKRILDTKPCVDELKANEAYITYPNQEYKREIFSLPEFHHKQSNESFSQDTGIKWTIDTKKKDTVDKTLTISEKKQTVKVKKKIKEDIFRKMQYWRETEKKSWDQIKEELVALQNDGIISDMGYADKKPEYFSNRYGDWKRKQSQPEEA